MKKKAMRASEKMIFPISMVFNGIEHVASNSNAVKTYADIANTAIIMTDEGGRTSSIPHPQQFVKHFFINFFMYNYSRKCINILVDIHNKVCYNKYVIKEVRIMMKYSTDYVFVWTYKENPKGRSVYMVKYFDTELERNKFALDVFTQAKQNKIILFYAEEKDIKKWKKIS